MGGHNNLLSDTTKFLLGVIVQVGLLLGLDLDDGVKEVLVGDEATLPPQGDHAGLHTHSFTLGSIEVICAPMNKYNICQHLYIYTKQTLILYLASSS